MRKLILFMFTSCLGRNFATASPSETPMNPAHMFSTLESSALGEIGNVASTSREGSDTSGAVLTERRVAAELTKQQLVARGVSLRARLQSRIRDGIPPSNEELSEMTDLEANMAAFAAQYWTLLNVPIGTRNAVEALNFEHPALTNLWVLELGDIQFLVNSDRSKLMAIVEPITGSLCLFPQSVDNSNELLCSLYLESCVAQARGYANLYASLVDMPRPDSFPSSMHISECADMLWDRRSQD